MIFNFTLFGSETEMMHFEQQFMEVLLRILNKDESSANEIHFCVHEAILNIIQHSYHWDHSKPIEVSLNFTDTDTQREVEILINDQGPAVSAPIRPPKNIHAFQMRQRGLYMIGQIMNEFSVTPAPKKGNITRMKKFIPLSSNTEGSSK